MPINWSLCMIPKLHLISTFVEYSKREMKNQNEFWKNKEALQDRSNILNSFLSYSGCL